MATFKKSTMIVAIGIISMALIVGQGHGLKVGFYKGQCGGKDVEGIIFSVVKANFNESDTAAALLRMQFHDCFVRGCDASILLEGKNTEKTAGPNESVRGYELIDDAKLAVEKECPGVVSCADVIVIATRAAVLLQSGFKYEVETGREDGLVSIASEADDNLPSPSVSISKAVALFAQPPRNLTAEDFVLLLGSHTIGITHCSFVQSRLYNFEGTSETDPSMNSTLAEPLKQTCPRDGSGAGNPIFLDQTPGSENTIDTGYLEAIRQGKGVLEIDQRMATDPLTKDIVVRLLNEDFLAKFGEAMVKLGRVPQLTGAKGEIRSKCSSTNAGNQLHRLPKLKYG